MNIEGDTDYILEEGLHIRKEFLDDNVEGFQERKGMSSVFE